MAYTESHYENAVLQLFQEQLGYTYVYGPDVARDYRFPLYEDILLPCLRRVNPALPMDALNEAVYKLKNFESGTLLQKNMAFTDYLQNGVPVKYFVNGEERSALVYLVDYKNPDNNDFTIANQWTVVENSEKRPDVILFVNGLPLVVVELKSPSREETDASAAYRQLRNYMHEIPSLFVYNTVCVMSDMTHSKAGTITSGEDRYMEWKTAPPARTARAAFSGIPRAVGNPCPWYSTPTICKRRWRSRPSLSSPTGTIWTISFTASLHGAGISCGRRRFKPPAVS